MDEESRTGQLLAATPMLGDVNFRRTIVLIVEDDPEEGTLGVVLNRPSEIPVQQVLEPWTELVTGPSVLFQGGPVSPDSALALALPRGENEPIGWRSLSGSKLMSRIGLVDLGAPPELLADGIASLRVFAGYAGWAPASWKPKSTSAPGWCSTEYPRTPSPTSRTGSTRRSCGGRAVRWRCCPPTRTTRCSTEPA